MKLPEDRLGQHLFTEKCNAENFGLFALYPCYFLSVFLAAPYPTFGYSRGNPGTIQFDCNPLNHLATLHELQKILSPDFYSIFSKRGDFSNTQNRYRLSLRCLLGLCEMYSSNLYRLLINQINGLKCL